MLAMKKIGLIQTYTGSGKGKSSSAFGLAFRAVAYDWNILIAQFLKGDPTGELKTCEKFKDNITVLRGYKEDKIVLEHNKDEEDRVLTQRLWNNMLYELTAWKEKPHNNYSHNLFKPYNMLIMDEILPAICLNLVTQKQFFDFIKDKPKDLEIVLTGRIWNDTIYDKIKNISDLMTDGKCVKHYFEKTCKPCKRSFEYRSNYCPNCGSGLESVPARKGVEF